MYSGEKLNSISHLIGAVLALVGFGALLTTGIQSHQANIFIGNTTYGLMLVILYTTSTLYHSFRPVKLKKLFQKLDHISIYLLIAGTYTPFMLVSLKSHNGLWILAFVWGLALVGITLELSLKKRQELLQVAIYLLMGWSCTVEFSALKSALQANGMAWLILGGGFYTVGIIFYALDDFNALRHAHGIWHLFVLAGSISHFIAVIGYVY